MHSRRGLAIGTRRGGVFRAVAAALLACLCSCCTSAAIGPPGATEATTFRIEHALADGVGIVILPSPGASLLACYWGKASREAPVRLTVSSFNLVSGVALSEVAKDGAQPPRASDGWLIPVPLHLYVSREGPTLACTGMVSGRKSAIWALSTGDLHSLGSAEVPDIAEPAGISPGGKLLASWLDQGGIGTPAASATIFESDINRLSTAPGRTVIHFVEPGWRLNSLGLDGLFWVQNERIAANGEPRVTAYSVETGKPVATRQVPLLDAAKAAPPVLPRPKGMPLLPPTTLPPPQTPDLPQLTQIQAGHGRLLAVVNQTGSAWHAWSRLLVLSATSARVLMSPVLDDCDLLLSATSPDGRWAIGSCDRTGRVWFDNYAIQRSEGVILSTETGAILATFPLNKRRPPLSMAVADAAGTIIAAVYDHVGEIRIFRFPDAGANPN